MYLAYLVVSTLFVLWLVYKLVTKRVTIMLIKAVAVFQERGQNSSKLHRESSNRNADNSEAGGGGSSLSDVEVTSHRAVNGREPTQTR